MQTKQLYPTNFTDSQWNLIKEMIPEARPGGRTHKLGMRAVVNAILYLVVSGIQWRMLPKEYPKRQSIYHYFCEWHKSSLWQRIHDTLRARVREKEGRHNHPMAGCIDSQCVKMTLVPGLRGYDAGKNVMGRKRHILVDTLRLMLGAAIPVMKWSMVIIFLTLSQSTPRALRFLRILQRNYPANAGLAYFLIYALRVFGGKRFLQTIYSLKLENFWPK